MTRSLETDFVVVGGGYLEPARQRESPAGDRRRGAPEDPRTVVAPSGRVLGLDGLYVADASVFLEVPRANTNLPTITAADRLSELIRGAARAGQPAATVGG